MSLLNLKMMMQIASSKANIYFYDNMFLQKYKKVE